MKMIQNKDIKTISILKYITIIYNLFFIFQIAYSQNLVVNGDFESNFLAPPPNSSGTLIAPPWQFAEVNTGSVFGAGGPSHMAELDLAANPTQTINGFIPGKCYRLSFQAQRRTVSCSPNPTQFNVTITGTSFQANETLINTTSGFTQFSYVFNATSTSHDLVFSPFGNSATSTCGTIIDDVSIEPIIIQASLLSDTVYCTSNSNFTLQYYFTGGVPEYDVDYSINSINQQQITTVNNVLTITLSQQLPDTLQIQLNYVSDPSGCVQDLNIQNIVIINQTPSPTLYTSNDTICNGESAVIFSNYYSNIVWNTGETDSIISVNNSGFYFLTVDENGCIGNSDTFNLVVLPYLPIQSINVQGNLEFCIGDSVILSSISNYGNVWSTGETTQSIIVSTPGDFWVVSNNGLCEIESDTVTIQLHDVPTSPLISLVNQSELCVGDTAILISSITSNITWSNNSSNDSIYVTENGDYYVYTNGSLCNSDTTHISIYFNSNPTPPNIINLGADNILCGNDTTLLESISTFPIIWSTGDTSNQITITNPGLYWVTTTDDHGCSTNSDTIFITQTTITWPNLMFSEKSDCAPLIVDFTLLGNENEFEEVFWDFGDGNSNYSSELSVSHQYENPGVFSFSFQITTIDDCRFDTTYQNLIEVFSNPVTDFSFYPTSISEVNSYVQFTDLSENVAEYSWNFANQNVSNEENPSNLFDLTDETTIEICLTGFSENGCADDTCKTIPIYNEFGIFVPNTFTPDADELNNIFKPILSHPEEVSRYSLTIYNRWGELIFESKNVNFGWDGTYLNRIVQEGVYTWKIEIATTKDAAVHLLNGHLQLLK